MKNRKEHSYTKEQIEWLRYNTFIFRNKELTNKFNECFGTFLTPNAIYRKCQKLGLRKEMGRYVRYAVGSERKNEDGYTYLKIANPDKWIPKQKYIYEQHYGKTPDGSIVIFLDKDKNNFNIDNLYLVERDVFTFASTRELLTKDAELTKAGLLIAKLAIEAKDKVR